MSLLLAFVLQAAAAVDPHSLSEWELLTHPSVWGAPGVPWKNVPMWPGVADGGISGPFWIAPHTPATPLALQFWSYPSEDLARDAAAILAPWFLDPEKPVVVPPEPDPRKPKATERAPWSQLERLGERRPAVAFTTFSSPHEEVRVARVSGARWFLWNGEPFVADCERRGFEGVPVLVRSGANRVFVAADGEPFEFALHEPRSTLYVDRFDIVWPGTQDPLGGEVGLNVFNASANPISNVHTHYGHVSGWTANCTPVLTDWRDGGHAQPLCMTRQGTYYEGFQGECPTYGGKYVAVSVFTGDGSPAERLLLRRDEAWRARHSNNLETVVRPTSGPSLTLGELMSDRTMYVHAGAVREKDSLACARVLQQGMWYRTGRVPVLVPDEVACAAQSAGRSLERWDEDWKEQDRKGTLVLGNSTTNRYWATAFRKTAGPTVVENRVEFEERVYEGEDLAGWFASEAGDGPGAAAIFDTGAKGARLALLLSTTWRGARSRFAIFRVDPSQPSGWVRLDEPETR